MDDMYTHALEVGTWCSRRADIHSTQLCGTGADPPSLSQIVLLVGWRRRNILDLPPTTSYALLPLQLLIDGFL